MSQYYYQQQRQEDIASLQCMFGPPWTFDLLGSVLDYYDGNVDEAISKLLILNEHHHGNPEPLVERLVLSGAKRINSNSNNHHHSPFASPPARNQTGGGTQTSTAAVPKAMLKKAPPPRRSEVTVTMADTFQPAFITIEKQTRRRVGIPMKLPDDFLRIPKTPLFSPHSLDLLRNMPPPLPTTTTTTTAAVEEDAVPEDPWQNTSSSSKDTFSATIAQQQQSAAAKFQALRASLTFPTFQKNTTANSPNNLQRTHQATNNIIDNNNTTKSPALNNMLGSFSVPPKRMTLPTLHLPKLALQKSNHEDATTNSPTVTNGSPTPPWGLAWKGASSSWIASRKASPLPPPLQQKNHHNSTNTTTGVDSTIAVVTPGSGAEDTTAENSSRATTATKEWMQHGLHLFS